MEINLSQLESYAADIKRDTEKLEEIKRRLEYSKLQAKQTRQMAARAKRDPDVKALLKAYPADGFEVMPAPGSIWCSIHLRGISKSLYLDVPAEAGFEEYRLEAPDALQSHHYFRKSGSPVILIVTEHHT